MKNRLFLSVGMPRAGSGWHYNLLHDLVLAGGGQDARQVRRRYHLERLLTEVNCNIRTLRPQRLIPVVLPAYLGSSYAVKTHAGPTGTALSLIRSGRITATYIYRDPRAAMLSAFEYGQGGIQSGRSNAFSDLTSLDEAGAFIERYIEIWAAWQPIEQVLVARYEDLVQAYDQEVQRLVNFLNLQLDDSAFQQVLEKYRPEQGPSGHRGTHFNKGETQRFRQALPPQQLESFTIAFGPALRRMGYLP